MISMPSLPASSKKKTILFFCFFCLLSAAATAQQFTRQDTLRGSNGPGRSWWDVQHYALSVDFDFPDKSIKGTNLITFVVTAAPHDSLQLDLQELMFLDRVDWIYKRNSKNVVAGDEFFRELETMKDGNVFWVKVPAGTWEKGDTIMLQASYHGRPRAAVRPPWDGGFSWTKDSNGLPWVAVSCQGLGASCWWPCKDDQGDEPDAGMDLFFGYPDSLMLVTNGRYDATSKMVTHYEKEIFQGQAQAPVAVLHKTERAGWHLRNPINLYNVTFYIGDYVHWSDTLTGEKGRLDLDFYALRENEAKARQHFAVTKQMLHCFEHWFGPYPFYEDGYKLVEAPYLGMEHQSAVAYGNKYKMGYLGSDRSGSGVGMAFDYIIIHESGHEWFGNNITAKDQADNWIHEGFTTYSETIFAECLLGKDKARAYNLGEWNNIGNDRPMIGPYGVNQEGHDIYDKGSAMLHMMRTLLDNDEKFRQMLRGLNQEFYHRTVTTAQVETYISRSTGYDFQPFFDQYLRTTQIPELQWYRKDKKLYYRFANTVPGFSLILKVGNGQKEKTIRVGREWEHITWKGNGINFQKDFLIRPVGVKEVDR